MERIKRRNNKLKQHVDMFLDYKNYVIISITFSICRRNFSFNSMNFTPPTGTGAFCARHSAYVYL